MKSYWFDFNTKTIGWTKYLWSTVNGTTARPRPSHSFSTHQFFICPDNVHKGC